LAYVCGYLEKNIATCGKIKRHKLSHVDRRIDGYTHHKGRSPIPASYS